MIVDLLPHDRDDFRRQMGQVHPGFDPDQLRATLASAGFADVAIISLPPEPSAKAPALFIATADTVLSTSR